MRIGQLAAKTGCPVETIRYFEKIGLLPHPMRGANGYREYEESQQKWLQFILRSRALGFTQNVVRRLSDIAHQSQPACGDVRDLLIEHIADVEEKQVDLERMHQSLERLKARCQDGTLNDCPVIDELMN